MQAMFFKAISSRDFGRVKSLLSESPALIHSTVPCDPQHPAMTGGTALHLSVRAGNTEIARLLLSSGIDIDARNDEGRTALHDSIEHGESDIMHLLLDQGAEVDICAAAILGRIERVRECLEQAPQAVNDRSTQLSPLGWASFGNQVEVARELLARGARMDDRELLCAASVGHVEVGRVLLEHGADPDKNEPRSGLNALHAAAHMRYTHDSSDFVSMLLVAGADPKMTTLHGKTALEIAQELALSQGEHPPGQLGEQSARNYEGVAAIVLNAMRSDI